MLPEVSRENFLILALVASFSLASAVFFLGEWAKAEGSFVLPGFLDSPINFGATSGLAAFVVALVIISLAFGYINIIPPPPTPTPSEEQPAPSAGGIRWMPFTLEHIANRTGLSNHLPDLPLGEVTLHVPSPWQSRAPGAG